MDTLSTRVREFAVLEGAVAAGISTPETLAGGPPSTDLTHVLEGAQAAVCFAIGLDAATIPPFLAKKDRLRFERELIRANVVASGIALHLANFLEAKGFKSVPIAANLEYRTTEDGSASYDPLGPVHPNIAHRYLAVSSGLGHLGSELINL